MFAGRAGRLFFACITRSACFLCGFVAFALYGQNPFQYYTFDFMGFLVIIVQVMDYVTPMLGTKYSGGGKWGNRGCMIGTIAGLFVFPPWGVLIGPFAGAVIGELFGGKKSAEAFKAGLGAFVGFLFSVVVKVSVCGYFIYSFVAALF